MIRPTEPSSIHGTRWMRPSASRRSSGPASTASAMSTRPTSRRRVYDPRPMAESASQRKIRVVVAKPGLDVHDRGAEIIARALRDAGMEVIYTGLHQTPEQIVETALQEDADAVGLSLLSGAHNYIFPRVSELMKQKGLDDVLLFGGGIIPEADWPALRAVGVERVFPPGASLEEITTYVREAVARKRGAVA